MPKKHLPGEETDSVIHFKAPQLKSILTVKGEGWMQEGYIDSFFKICYSVHTSRKRISLATAKEGTCLTDEA